MTEVEKLYELAGVEKKLICPHFCSKNACFSSCEKYKDIKEYYPPFTAEKQIELIKFLGSISYVEVVEIRYFENDWCISIVYPDETKCFDYVETGRCKVFELALAELLIELWEHLTTEEQEQIREILK